MASVARRANGKWEARYLDEQGRHRSKSFTLKKHADVYARDVLASIERGEHIAAADVLKVRDVCRLFTATLDDRLDNGQISIGRHGLMLRSIRLHILPTFGPMEITAVTPGALEDWIRTLRRGGNRVTGGKLAPGTIAHVVQAFKQMEDFAVRRGHLKKRSVAEAQKAVGRTGRPRIRTFMQSEVQQLLAALNVRRNGQAHDEIHVTRCIVLLGMCCGLRIGEILALTPSDVDHQERVIRVRHSLTREGLIKGPKTKAGVRDVPMPSIVSEALLTLSRQPRRLNARGTLFSSRNGEQLQYGAFAIRWSLLVKAAGLSDGAGLHFHALRHFAASMMIEHGLPLTDVAKMLGHETYDMTLQTYAHPVLDTARHHAAMDAIALEATAPITLQALPAPKGSTSPVCA